MLFNLVYMLAEKNRRILSNEVFSIPLDIFYTVFDIE